MHIGIVNWSLCRTRGGVQQVGADLAHAMLERGHTVTMFYRRFPGASPTPLTPLDPAISLLPLDITSYARPRPALRQQLAKARSVIASSDVEVLAALFSWKALLLFPALLRGTGIPLLISEHNAPNILDTERWNAYERHACLAAADRVHILLHSFLPLYPDFLRDRIAVIPNAVPGQPPIPPREYAPGRPKRLLAAGRFRDEHKRFSLLLRAFALLAPRFPDWTLTLCGGGRDAGRYTKLIARLGIRDRVELPGMADDMPRWYRESDLFCIPSRYEGFGLVTAEAGGFGLPAVGFAACSGTNELIIHGENGLLAEEETPACLARRLAELMGDPELRKRMGEQGRALCTRFDPKEVFDRWETLLQETARCKGNTRLQGFESPRASGGQPEDETETHLREILRRPSPFARPWGLRRVLLGQRAALLFRKIKTFCVSRLGLRPAS